jgi:serine/threonine protein kinase
MHPNIVRFVDWFEDQEYVYIILELCENRTLLDLLHIKKKFTEAEAARLLFELASAVHYLHSKLVLHRDLKVYLVPRSLSLSLSPLSHALSLFPFFAQLTEFFSLEIYSWPRMGM